MDHGLEAPEPLTLRMIRQEFIRYGRDTYPRYGEGRLPRLSYVEFKAKLQEEAQLHEELFTLYGDHTDLKGLPAELRTRLVSLEVRMSQLEYELCKS